MPPFTTLREALIGSWDLQRSLSDGNGGQGTFDGTLTFAPTESYPGALSYEESGTLHWTTYDERGRLAGEFSTQAQRRYLLFQGAHPWALDWYFAGPDSNRGEYFHTMDFSTAIGSTDPAVATAEHLCKADLYRVRYSVLDTDTIHALWLANGPHKALTLESIWHRTRENDCRAEVQSTAN